MKIEISKTHGYSFDLFVNEEQVVSGTGKKEMMNKLGNIIEAWY